MHVHARAYAHTLFCTYVDKVVTLEYTEKGSNSTSTVIACGKLSAEFKMVRLSMDATAGALGATSPAVLIIAVATIFSYTFSIA